MFISYKSFFHDFFVVSDNSNGHKISLLLRNLTGVKISSEEDAIKAMQILHDKGPRTVVISSSEFSHDTSIICLASSVTSTYYSREQHWGGQRPILNSTFKTEGRIKKFQSHDPPAENL